jgi:acetyl-CoA C-acetyltransferase/acetyl-CoA acyltransferase
MAIKTANKKERIAIIDGLRTPMGKMGGKLARVQADNLGAHVTKEVIAKADFDAALIDHVIFGNVGMPAHAMNIARVIALKAGLSKTIPAFTVHRNCASGMEAISSAGARIRAGDGEIMIAGGTESMSNIPFIFNEKGKKFFTELGSAKTTLDKLKVLTTLRLSAFSPKIGLMLGLHDIVAGMNMGQTAEVLAKEFRLTREEQDEFATMSHNRAEAGRAKLAEEIVPIVCDPSRGDVLLQDEGIRDGQSVAALAKLKPYFDRKTGTVTAGNSSQITDGAAAVIVMSESRAKQLKLEPLGYISDWAYAGLDPHRMGMGPLYATQALFKKTGAKLKDMDLLEINEAFAAQVIAVERGFEAEGLGKINRDILNVNGGAIALGHPVGMTGTRIIITLMKELRRRNKNTGLASLCIGGGQGAAVQVEIS